MGAFMSQQQILYCRCKYANVVPRETKDAVFEDLAGRGEPFHAVPDLCEMAARRDPALQRYQEQEGLTIVACYPRAVRALFTQAGTSLPQDAQILNMREDDAETIAQQLQPTHSAQEVSE